MDSGAKGIMGEAFVSLLATKTFLSYWCYPNPHDELGDKKEICDLLIVFREFCIICQVKNYEFKKDHKRYFRKTIDAASRQLAGAERKLFDFGRDIYIKHPKKGIIRFEKEKCSQIVRLAIHLGEGIQYQNLCTSTGKKEGFVHIIGKSDLEYILSELPTISDFTDYFIARQNLLTDVKELLVTGEEKDLLGLYLTIKPRFSEFIAANKGNVMLLDLENAWNEHVSKKPEQEDVLIEVEKLISEWVQTDLILRDESINVAEELMSLNRYARRLFAILFVGFCQEYTYKENTRIIRRHLVLNGIGFVFFYYPDSTPRNQVEPLMAIAGEGFSYFLNYETTNIIVVGISEKDKFRITHMDMDISKFKDYKVEELKRILDYLGWFQEESLTPIKPHVRLE